jgi:hypothetical protein
VGWGEVWVFGKLCSLTWEKGWDWCLSGLRSDLGGKTGHVGPLNLVVNAASRKDIFGRTFIMIYHINTRAVFFCFVSVAKI